VFPSCSICSGVVRDSVLGVFDRSVVFYFLFYFKYLLLYKELCLVISSCALASVDVYTSKIIVFTHEYYFPSIFSGILIVGFFVMALLFLDILGSSASANGELGTCVSILAVLFPFLIHLYIFLYHYYILYEEVPSPVSFCGLYTMP